MNTQNIFILLGTTLHLIVAVEYFSVNGQPVPWSAELSPVTFPGITDEMMRVYGNLAAFYGQEALKFCYYDNGTISNCIIAVTRNQDVTFESPSGEFHTDDTGVYFIGLGFVKRTISVYQLSKNKDLTLKIARNASVSVFHDLFRMSIDYRHRWMVVGSNSYLFMYDIMNPLFPRLINRSGKLSVVLVPRGISIYKNRACTCNYGDGAKGLVCFTVKRGQFVARKSINPDDQFTFVKIYEDFIIGGTANSDAPILIYNSSTLELVASTFPGVGIMDLLRSSDTLVVGNNIQADISIINISDPRTPALLQSSPLKGDWAGSFSVDPQYLYTSLLTYPSRYYQTQINFPGGMNWSTFYANSEWNGYGRAQNTLALQGPREYIWIFGITQWLKINENVVDTYLPDDIDMKLTVNVPAPNFALEVFDGSVWSAVSKGQIITRPSFSSAPANNSLRIRDLNPDQPLKQPLNQTMELTADNGRGSQLTYNISIVRIYQSGPGCPLNGRCNNLAIFWCITGFIFDGTQCTNFRKQRSAWLDYPIIGVWILSSSIVILFLIAFVAGFFESYISQILLGRTTNVQTLTTESLASTRVDTLCTVNTTTTGTTKMTETIGTTDTTVIDSEAGATLTCHS